MTNPGWTRIVAPVNQAQADTIVHFGGKITPIPDEDCSCVELPEGWRFRESDSTNGVIYDAIGRERAITTLVNHGRQVAIQLKSWFVINRDPDEENTDGVVTVRVINGNGSVVHIASSSPHLDSNDTIPLAEAVEQAKIYLAKAYPHWKGEEDTISYWLQ